MLMQQTNRVGMKTSITKVLQKEPTGNTMLIHPDRATIEQLLSAPIGSVREGEGGVSVSV